MGKMKDLLEGNGPDGLYTPMMTAEGTLTFGDLREFGAPVDFIGQAWHTTLNGVYNDTINFTIEDMGDNVTHVKAFSISQIGGAYGDAGQNFWNIKQVFDNIHFENNIKFVHNDGSCKGPLGEKKSMKDVATFMNVEVSECPEDTEACVYNTQGATECCTPGEMCIKGVGCRC